MTAARLKALNHPVPDAVIATLAHMLPYTLNVGKETHGYAWVAARLMSHGCTQGEAHALVNILIACDMLDVDTALSVRNKAKLSGLADSCLYYYVNKVDPRDSIVAHLVDAAHIAGSDLHTFKVSFRRYASPDRFQIDWNRSPHES